MSNDLLIDKRIIERNIKKGRLDAVEHRKMLDALPDLHGQLWQRPEYRAHEREAPAAAPQQAVASVPPPPAASAYVPSEPAAEAEDEEPEDAPLPSPNQPSPFG